MVVFQRCTGFLIAAAMLTAGGCAKSRQQTVQPATAAATGAIAPSPTYRADVHPASFERSPVSSVLPPPRVEGAEAIPAALPARESLEDLEGKTVAVQQGTTGQELAKEKLGGSEIRPYPEGPDAVNALKAGTVEGVIIDAPVAQNAVEKAGGVEIAEKVPTEEKYGIALAKDNTELLEEINQGLREVIDDGTYTKIYEKWFKLEPPKAIVG